MTEKLPKGWVKTTLGEIRLDASLGISQQQMRGDTFELYSVPSFEERNPEIVLGEKVGSNKATIAQGDVLLCKINPRINRAWVVGEPKGHRQIASTEWIVFSKQDGVIPEFLAYFFGQDTFRNYLSANASGVGGSLMRVNTRVVDAYPIALPPSREQQRILAKLEASLSRVTAGEAAATRVLDRLPRYRRTVLHAAVTGELTKQWRDSREATDEAKVLHRLLEDDETGEELLTRLLSVRRARWEDFELKRLHEAGKTPKDDKWKSRYREPTPPRKDNLPVLPESWTWASLDQLGDLNRGKSKHRPRDDARLYGGPYPFIQTGDVRKSRGTISEYTQTYSDFGLKQSRIWPAGTLCITIAANIAETGILTYRACFPDSIVGFVQDDDLLKVRFVEFFIRAEKSKLERYAPATAQKNINLELLKGLAIPLPPFEEQVEIVRQAEHYLSLADRLETKAEQLLVQAHSIRQSILRDAFTGCLVSQDSNDEPASVLLDRIRAAREAEATKPKAKRMPKSKSKTVRRPLLDVLREHKKPMTPELLFQEAGFQPADADLFYRELASLRKLLLEKKPSAAEAKSWPHHAKVLLELKES